MSLKTRIEKLENAMGIKKLNVAIELQRLKALALAGNSPPELTSMDYKKLIKECTNPKLRELYEAHVRLTFH